MFAAEVGSLGVGRSKDFLSKGRHVLLERISSSEGGQSGQITTSSSRLSEGTKAWKREDCTAPK